MQCTLQLLDPRELPDEAWSYRNWRDLDGHPFWGLHGTYSGGGYVAELGSTSRTAQSVTQTLKEHNWLDKDTRAVVAEFLVYNPNVNLFTVGMLMFEFSQTGGKLRCWFGH